MNNRTLMNGMRLLVAATLCSILVPATTARGQNPSARAHVDPPELTVGETFQLVLEISGVRELEQVADPVVLQSFSRRAVPEGMTVDVRIGDATAGVAESRFTVSFDFVAFAAGSFEVGPFRITADGQTLETQTVTVQVNPREQAEVTVEVWIAPERVSVGRTFTLSAEIRGSSFAEHRFILPDVFDFAESGGGGSSATSWNWGLRALVPGEFVIPPVRVVDPDHTYESEPLTVVIEPAPVVGQATVEAGSIWVGGEFNLKLEVTGARELDQEPVLPEIGAFAELVELVDSSASPPGMQGVSNVEREYRFRALRAGRFEIGPLRTSVDGQPMATDPISITVDEVPTLETDPPGSLVFVSVPDRTRAYVNEPVVVTYSLAHDRSRGLGPRLGTRSWPSADGFRVLERQPWGGFEDLHLDGRSLEQDIVRRVTLLPREPGALIVDRGMVEARWVDRFGGWNRATGRPEMTSIVLASEPFTLEVLPLPDEGRPASFRGHVGTLSVASGVDRTRVSVGETVTLEVEVSLEGHAETLTDPEIAFPDGFTVSEPEISTNSRESRGVLSGSRTYVYRLTAVDPGTYRIPAVEMSFFDAETESYGTARGHPFTITVVPAGREGR